MFPLFPQLKQDCWTEIPDQNMIMNLNILAATVRSFKMLIDYALDRTPPFSPSLTQKKEKTKKLL